MNILKTSFAALLAIVLAVPAQADDDTAVFAYDQGNSTYKYGTGKKENYDVAIHLDGSFVGKTVTAISVPFSGTEGVGNLKVWLSKELTLEGSGSKKRIAPDVTTQDGTVADGYVTVTLADPYTITSEGVYAGYSVDVDSLSDDSKKPIIVNTDAVDGGFFVHTTRTYLKWQDQSSIYNSPLRVSLSGVYKNAATVSIPSVLHQKVDAATPVTLTLANSGSNAISSIDYTYEVGEQTDTGHLDVAIAAQLGLKATTTIELPAQANKGAYPVKLTITKVNGEANSVADASAASTLNIYGFLPKHRAVLEEYTGTWCGYCPRGFVGLEVLNRLYPDDFIGISYHNGYYSGASIIDPMDIMPSSQYPSTVTGFPDAWLERTTETDAYYGDSEVGFGIDKAWLAACEQFAPAAVTVEGVMNDENTVLTVNASVAFVGSYTGTDYGVELVVLEDDLHAPEGNTDDGWNQSNYYSGYSSDALPEPEFEQFLNGGSTVEGVHYNFVIVGTTRLRGTNTPLPTDIVADQSYDATATFEISSLVNQRGEQVVQDVNKLRVVALLIDNNTGAIVNANKGIVTGKNVDGIATVQTAKDNGVVEVYDLSGRRIQGLQKGINIVRTADGHVTKALTK